ncbi:MAG: hypothetical protein IPI77_23435 [Saprospiraceae bacterium]|nr:hypothetical protein [Saprospiraceae bacterium]
MSHYALQDDKPDAKLDLGLSRQGMIWEQLLTDQDGQYVRSNPDACLINPRMEHL